jgi:hypothetical protein
MKWGPPPSTALTWMSIAMTQPCGPTSRANASVSWPLPHVASTTVSPGDTRLAHAALAASVVRAPPDSSPRSRPGADRSVAAPAVSPALCSCACTAHKAGGRFDSLTRWNSAMRVDHSFNAACRHACRFYRFHLRRAGTS